MFPNEPVVWYTLFVLTSNNNALWGNSRMRSPLANVNSLLSSMTEFMFSIHRASTSPSNNIYFLAGLFSGMGLFISRNMLDSRPSVQSLVTRSKKPYSSTTVQACKWDFFLLYQTEFGGHGEHIFRKYFRI